MERETRDLAVWLREEMERRGLTQGQVATYSAIGRQTISNILHRRHRRVELETLTKLADWSGADLEELKRLARWTPIRTRASLVETDLVRQIQLRYPALSPEALRQILEIVARERRRLRSEDGGLLGEPDRS